MDIVVCADGAIHNLQPCISLCVWILSSLHNWKQWLYCVYFIYHWIPCSQHSAAQSPAQQSFGAWVQWQESNGGGGANECDALDVKCEMPSF